MNYNVPEVDLNLRYYIGDRADSIKTVQRKIKKYLKTSEIDYTHKSIYSAIYNALAYYQVISSLPISGETEEKTFLENTISQINDDYNYLSTKYNTNGNEVITIRARIKSPINAMDKILTKIEEYVKDGRDLRRLNESLRDFIGIRIIVNCPPEVKAQGKQAESDFCYKVFNDLVEYHGIRRQLSGETPKETDYDFIPVNTSADPNKLEKIKNRAIKKQFKLDPEKEDVFIPHSRPKFIEDYDGFVKDYRLYPKPHLYQRMHICAHPHYSDSITRHPIPNYIIPPISFNPAIEYQVCTKKEDIWADASHLEYKDRPFHRLGIPILVELDQKQGKFRLLRLDECIKDFYGYSFKDMFDIDYQNFLNLFNTAQRDDILAGKVKVEFDKELEEYILEKSPTTLVLYEDKNVKFVNELLQNSSEEELKRFYEANNLRDNSIYANESISFKGNNHKIKAYMLKNHNSERNYDETETIDNSKKQVEISTTSKVPSESIDTEYIL